MANMAKKTLISLIPEEEIIYKLKAYGYKEIYMAFKSKGGPDSPISTKEIVSIAKNQGGGLKIKNLMENIDQFKCAKIPKSEILKYYRKKGKALAEQLLARYQVETSNSEYQLPSILGKRRVEQETLQDEYLNFEDLDLDCLPNSKQPHPHEKLNSLSFFYKPEPIANNSDIVDYCSSPGCG